MRSFLLFGLLALLLGCSAKPNWKGAWKLELDLQGRKLPFVIELFEIGGGFAGKLHNSTEEIELISQNSIHDQKIKLEIGAHYAELNLEFLGDDKIKGTWVRTNKENYIVNLTGKKTTKSNELFADYVSKKTPTDINGNWEIEFEEGKKALGVFKQEGRRITGSILTNTGDYRFLVGKLEENQIYLQGFDGVFSFIFKLNLSDQLKFKGKMFSGKSYQTGLTGIRNPSFKLDDAYAMTKLTDDKPIGFLGVDLSGKKIDLSSDRYSNKPKIIQLFGSWCPNCIDETHFFNQWKEQNKNLASKIEFVALAFENFPSKKEALKAVKKSKAKLKMDYPIILVDFDKSKKPEDVLPIDKGRAFPTTLFLNKNNKVVKIHTGFSGPATGPFFEKFKESFQKTISELVSQ